MTVPTADSKPPVPPLMVLFYIACGLAALAGLFLATYCLVWTYGLIKYGGLRRIVKKVLLRPRKPLSSARNNPAVSQKKEKGSRLTNLSILHRTSKLSTLSGHHPSLMSATLKLNMLPNGPSSTNTIWNQSLRKEAVPCLLYPRCHPAPALSLHQIPTLADLG